ncbi:MAG: alpha/beta fold hydrolase [Nannocystaceae bacterium]
MDHRITALEVEGAIKLRAESWHPSTPARGVVVLVHGWGEHVGRYQHLTHELTKAGFAVVGADHRGMGASEGRPGDIESFRSYAADVEQMLAYARGEFSGRPLIVYAHGVGAIVEMLRLLDRGGVDTGVRGSVLASPLLSFSTAPPLMDRLRRVILERTVPRTVVRAPFDIAALCRDQAAADTRTFDRRCTIDVSAGWRRALKRSMREVRDGVIRLRAASLWLAPTGDRIADFRATLRSFERLENPRRDAQSIHCFEGAAHELHNEPAPLRRELFDVVLPWVERRCDL